jgi:site-specific recombinase XerD
MISFETLYEEYEQLVILKGYKTGGGTQYLQAISEFFSFLRQRGYMSFEVISEDMVAYYEYVSTRPNQRRAGTLSQSSINHHLFAIKILFDYVLRSGYMEALPVIPKYQRTRQEPKEILTIPEVKSIYEATKNLKETALLSCAYGLGLRRSEIVSLQLSDIDLKLGKVVVRSGKGGKRREVPMSDKVIVDIRDYVHYERNMRGKKVYNLFTAPMGNRLTGYYMNELIGKIAKGVPGLQDKSVTLHTMRRSIATHLIERGASIHFVKDFLGHSDIDTAQLYAMRRKRKHSLS